MKHPETTPNTPGLDTEHIPLTFRTAQTKSRGSQLYKSPKTSISTIQERNHMFTPGTSLENLGFSSSILLPKGISSISHLKDTYREKKKIRVNRTFEMTYGREITAMIITSDSEYIISGSRDGTINVFYTVTGQLYKSMGRAHEGKINALTFGPLVEGTVSLISVSDDRAIKIMDWKHDIDSFYLQEAHESKITCVAYSNAKQQIISGSNDNHINVFSVKSDPLYVNISQRIPCYFTGPVTSLALKQDGLSLFCAGDSSIKVFNLETCKEVYHFKEAHNDTISSIVMSPDGLSLVSASHDISIKVWNIHEYQSQPLHHLENVHNEKIKYIDISSDSNFILSTGEKGSIKVSSLKEKLQVHQIPKNINNKCAIFDKTKETSSIILGAEGHIDILSFEAMQAPFYTKELSSEEKERFESENILSANHQYILSYDWKYGNIKIFDSNTLRIIDNLSHQIGI